MSRRPTYQERVNAWLKQTFSQKIRLCKTERNHRFLEESLELIQACGCTQSEAHQIVDYVFGRPEGEKSQEVGGVMNTLAALCIAHGLDMQKAADQEMVRVWRMIEKIQAKQITKPKFEPI